MTSRIAPPRPSGAKAGLAILGIVGAALVTILIFGLDVPQETVVDRMKRECERQFSDQGQIVVNDCSIRLTTRYFAEQRQDKLNSAYQRAR